MIRAAELGQVTELRCRRPGCRLGTEVLEATPADAFSPLERLEWEERLDRETGVTYPCKLAVPASDDGCDPYRGTAVSRSAVVVAGDGVDATMIGSRGARRASV